MQRFRTTRFVLSARMLCDLAGFKGYVQRLVAGRVTCIYCSHLSRAV